MENIQELITAIKENTEAIKKNQDRLMTAEEIMEEFKIGQVTVYEMFKDKDLPVQKYTKPMKVLRSEFFKYLTVRHPNFNK